MKRGASIVPFPSKKLKKSQMAVSIVAAIFLVLLYIVIFTFSEQDGNSSGHLSHELTKWLVEGYEKLIHGSFSEEIRNGWISYWEHPVRKLAHFSEYAVMSVLIFLVLNPFGKKGWKKNLLIVSWVFVSAALDEWHQTFVADRCGTFWDVLLDTCGGAFGLLCCLGIQKLCEKRKKTSRERK